MSMRPKGGSMENPLVDGYALPTLRRTLEIFRMLGKRHDIEEQTWMGDRLLEMLQRIEELERKVEHLELRGDTRPA